MVTQWHRLCLPMQETRLIPGPEAPQPLSLCLKPGSCTYESPHALDPVLHKWSHHSEKPEHTHESSPCSLQPEKSPHSSEEPAHPKIHTLKKIMKHVDIYIFSFSNLKDRLNWLCSHLLSKADWLLPHSRSISVMCSYVTRCLSHSLKLCSEELHTFLSKALRTTQWWVTVAFLSLWHFSQSIAMLSNSRCFLHIHWFNHESDSHYLRPELQTLTLTLTLNSPSLFNLNMILWYFDLL